MLSKGKEIITQPGTLGPISHCHTGSRIPEGQQDECPQSQTGAGMWHGVASVSWVVLCIVPVHVYNSSRCMNKPMDVLATSFPTADASVLNLHTS